MEKISKDLYSHGKIRSKIGNNFFEEKIIFYWVIKNFMRILITGVGGFMGFHVAKELISKGNVIIGMIMLTHIMIQN